MPYPCPSVIPSDDAIAAADGLAAAARAYADSVRQCQLAGGGPESVAAMTAAANALYECYLEELLVWYPDADPELE